MTPEREQLVRESWARVRPRGDALATAFYARLFETAPQTRVLFARTDMTLQRGKFVDMLSAIVDYLNRPSAFVAEVTALGRRHADYGVTVRDYGPVGEALMFALEHELGDGLTKETREAWREAYLLMAGLMTRGMQAAQTPS